MSTAVPVFVPDDSVIEHVSSPFPPYDVGEIYEIRVTTARFQRVLSIDFLSAAGRALPPRPFQTLVSHVDVISTVAHNCDDVIAITSLRRRGDEIRVTAARSRRVPSINVLSAAGRALPSCLPDLSLIHISEPTRPY